MYPSTETANQNVHRFVGLIAFIASVLMIVSLPPNGRADAALVNLPVRGNGCGPSRHASSFIGSSSRSGGQAFCSTWSARAGTSSRTVLLWHRLHPHSAHPPLDRSSAGYAPAAIVAPVGCVGVLANEMIAVIFLKEPDAHLREIDMRFRREIEHARPVRKGNLPLSTLTARSAMLL